MIIREFLTPDGVGVEVEGEAGTQHRLEFVSWGGAIRGGQLASIDGERGVIGFAFPVSTTKYSRQMILIELGK
jgi:hypothetical protein